MPYPYNYTKLWEPIQINGMKLRNRISLSPMGTYTPRLDGTDTEEGMRYYEERAKGGVGLIMTGAMFVNKQLAQGSPGIAVWDYHSIPSTTVLTERCHRWGAKVCLQLSGGCGRNGAIDTGATENMFSASDNPNFFDPSIICHALTIEEIKESLKDWAIDADIAVRSGFDAIEVHAHAGYIIDQFMSPIWNRRTDEYGGSAENRARFAVEAVKAIRSRLPEIPIDYKLAVRQEDPHYGNAGVVESELGIFVPLLTDAGVTSFHVTLANHSSLEDTIPPANHPYFKEQGCFLKFCDEVRQYTDKPITGVGGLNQPDFVEQQLASGRITCAAMSRQLLADPEWPNKVASGQIKEIHRCVRCNKKCLGGLQQHQGTHCIYEKV